MRYFVTIADRTFEVVVTDGVTTVDGVEVDAELATVPGSTVRHLLLNGRSHAMIAAPGSQAGRWTIDSGALRLAVDAIDERTRVIREMTGGADAAAEKAVLAPMPGLVVKVEVELGQAVTAGQGVLIVEAMKMENELKAPADGVIAEIRVTAGQTVEKGAVLLILE